LGLAVRYNDFSEKGGNFKLNQPQFRTAIVGQVLEDMFNRTIKTQHKPIRQIRITMQNLYPFQPQDTLWGQGTDSKVASLDRAADALNAKIGRNVIKTGTQYALEHLAKPMSNQKAKCPFVPQREMVERLGLLEAKTN
jgi:hypothetical protein